MTMSFTRVLIVGWFVGACAAYTLMGCSVKEYSKEGKQGLMGPAGEDGTAVCGTCHNMSTEVVAKTMQWQASKHATGGNFTRNSTNCAVCHSHEGFRERLMTGSITVVAAIVDPTPQNCRTCHNIHKNYDQSDLELSYSSPVTLLFNGATVDFGKGNLCAMCHQPRPLTPMPVLDGKDIAISTTNYGGHHGPQAATLGGTGKGYIEIPGSIPYENSPHTTMVTNGCVTCHMAQAIGVSAGGHTMIMSYGDNATPNLASCKACHTDITKFDVNGVQTEVKGLVADLRAKLVSAGIMTNSSESTVKGTYPALIAAARVNYQMILEDRSNGVHNAKYVKAVLKNTIEELSK